MSERKASNAIFAQRETRRKARISWLPQPVKAVPSRPSGPSQREPSDHTAAPTMAPPESHTRLVGDAPPAPESTADASGTPSEGGPDSDVLAAGTTDFFQAFQAMPPPPEPPPTTSVQAAIEAFVQAADALSEIKVLRHSRVERDLVELARAIATRVISRELSTDPSLLVALARDGLSALADRESVMVRFSGDVPEDLRRSITDTLTERTQGCTVTFDPELAPGSCVVESAQGYVDESVGTRLDVVMEQLGFGTRGLE